MMVAAAVEHEHKINKRSGREDVTSNYVYDVAAMALILGDDFTKLI